MSTYFVCFLAAAINLCDKFYILKLHWYCVL